MIKTDKPICWLDTETTGVNTEEDRIVELCVIKEFPDGHKVRKTRRFNPTIPIPAGASEIHGIFDADVANEPTFKQVAAGIHEFIKGCDIGGFNSNAFDIPMLYNEFVRSGIEWDYSGARFIDVGNIFKRLYQRRLEDAVKMFLGRDHDGAHGAEPDTIATMEVFGFFSEAMEFEQELPRDIDELHLYCNYDKPILDLSGKFTLNENKEIVFNFGKHRGEVASTQPGFLDWMLNKAKFAPDTCKIVKQILCQKD